MTRTLLMAVALLMLGGCYFAPSDMGSRSAHVDFNMPRYGLVGSEVRIDIRNLEDRPVQVRFGEVEAEVTGHEEDGVMVTVPEGFSTAHVHVRVLDAGDEDGHGNGNEDAGWHRNPHAFTATFSDDASWLAVGSASAHSCGIKEDHSLWCWADGLSGWMGVARPDKRDLVHRFIPVNMAGEWDRVSVPGYVFIPNSCGRQTDGSIWCWGENTMGPFSADMPEVVTEPTRLKGDWLDVQVGGGLTCGRKQADEELYCWTRAFDDDSDLAYLADPQQMGDGPWQSYSVGYAHACGIHDDQSLWCWGLNEMGQLGDGTTSASFSPVEVSGGVAWRQVTAAGMAVMTGNEDDPPPILGHTCGVSTEGELYCWGAGVVSPEQVGADSDWTSIDASLRRVCGIRDEGALWCWRGPDDHEMSRASPFSDWERFAPNGRGGGCGIREDGSLWCLHDDEMVHINQFVVPEER